MPIKKQDLETIQELLAGKNITHLATIMPDGSPQVTPVWANYQNGLVMINTAKGRVKHRNILHDKRVSISVTSIDNPLMMASVRGIVKDIIPDDNYKHADALTRQYMTGYDKYPFRKKDEQRIILAIRPNHAYVMPILNPSHDS